MSEADVDPRVDLAVERTELALERTQMAWIRTVLALCVSGVAIDRLVELTHQARLAAGTALISRAHALGLLLTIAGIVIMAMVTCLYWRRASELKRLRGKEVSWTDPALASSIITMVTAVAATVALWLTE